MRSYGSDSDDSTGSPVPKKKYKAMKALAMNQRKELGHLKAKKAAVVKAKKKKTVKFGVEPSQFSSDGGSESDDGFAYSATTNAAESD